MPTPSHPMAGGATVAAEAHGPPKILFDEQGVVMATWRNVALHVWTTRATPPLVEALDRFSERFVADHPEGISAIHVITEGSPLPDNDARERLRNVANRYAAHLACVCHVVEGSGFWASALQSFLTGLHWLTRGPYRLHICATMGDAAVWVQEQHERKTRVSFLASDLEAALEIVRARAPR